MRSFFFFLMGLSLLIPVTGTASPWRTDITGRPRLLSTQAQDPLFLDRVQRAPYTSLMSRVRSYANQTPQYNATQYDAVRERTNALIAKNCAFLYDLERNAAYAQKAAEILRNLNANLSTQSITIIDSVHYSADGVIAACTAYDILAGTGYVADGGSEWTKTAAFVSSFYQYHYVTNLALFQVWTNNLRIKASSALGVGALTFNTHQDASLWINRATTEVQRFLLDEKTATEGGYAEGTWYQQYSAISYLPFMVYLHRILGDASGTYVRRDCGVFGWPCTDTNVYVQDFLLNPLTRTLSEWALRLRMPDGNMPDLDDSNLSNQVDGFLTGIYPSGLFRWDTTRGSEPFKTAWGPDISPEFIALYDDTIPEQAPTWPPTQFLPDSGQAVLRSGWDTGAQYFLLLAEHGNQRTASATHEHADPLSFIYYAYGELLLMDSGYGGYSNHEQVWEGNNHNVILVDGQGPATATTLSPAGEEAFLENTFDTSFFDYAEGRSAWRSTNFRRHVLFPGHQYVIVMDEVTASASHTYRWLFHGNGGGSTNGSFSLRSDGGEWQRPGAKARVQMASTRTAPAFGSYDDAHSHIYPVMETHTVLKAEVEAQNVRMLSLLLPVAASDSFPAVTSLGSSGTCAFGIARNDGTDTVLTKENTLTVTVGGDAGQPPALQTDGGLAFRRADGNGAWTMAFAKGAKTFESGTETVFQATQAVTLALRRTWRITTGYAPQAASFSLFGEAPMESVAGATVVQSQPVPPYRVDLSAVAGASFTVVFMAEAPPAATMTPVPTATRTPTFTPTQTSTPLPASTPSPSPTGTPSPTLSPAFTPTAPREHFLLAGYWDTRLTFVQGGNLRLVALLGDLKSDGGNHEDLYRIEIFYDGEITLASLTDETGFNSGPNDGIWAFEAVVGKRSPRGRYPLELRLQDAVGSLEYDAWPRLEVSP